MLLRIVWAFMQYFIEGYQRPVSTGIKIRPIATRPNSQPVLIALVWRPPYMSGRRG
jgi:hypothetical protein